jgi:uncharacterized protein
MKISPKSIPPSGLKIREELASDFLGIQDELVASVSPISCELMLYLAGRTLIVTGALSAQARLACSRCLEEFDAPVSVPRFRTEIEAVDPDGMIDLTGPIREDIILALPYKTLCSPDCRGLCLGCGHNLNRGPCSCAGGQPGKDS